MHTDIAIDSLAECNKIWHAEHHLSDLELYAGFDYDRVKFLHGNCYGVVFWIRAGNSVDNTGMLSLLLSSVYTNLSFLPPTAPHLCRDWGARVQM